MHKGYKIRLYPTKEQEILIWKHFGASRFMWNHMVELQESNYKDGGKFISHFSMNKLVTQMKKEEQYSWLSEVSTATLHRTCEDVAVAYKRFFDRKNGHPRFRSRKKPKQSYPVRCEKQYFCGDCVFVEKLRKVKYKSDFKFPENKKQRYYNVRLSFESGKYFLSFDVECENQAYQLNDYSMGIDLGVKELAVVACGDEQYVFHNINKSKKMKSLDRKILYHQKCISRKFEESKKRNKGKYTKTNNIAREQAKVKKLYAKQANIRTNYIHQTTHLLVSKLPKRVTMEKLNVLGLMKNRHLSKAIQYQCFDRFIKQMQYKCKWRGIEFVQADRFYPSSKTCSGCGEIKKDLKLSDRMYVCHNCGLQIDRDYNAAINLMRYEA